MWSIGLNDGVYILPGELDPDRAGAGGSMAEFRIVIIRVFSMLVSSRRK